MAKYRIDIFRTEYFRGSVVIEASSAEEARTKIEQEWLENEGLYEAVTDCQFNDICPATERDMKECINID